MLTLRWLCRAYRLSGYSSLQVSPRAGGGFLILTNRKLSPYRDGFVVLKGIVLEWEMVTLYWTISIRDLIKTFKLFADFALD